MIRIALPRPGLPRLRILLHRPTRREVLLKSCITITFLATLALDAVFATHLAMAGNLIWLWVDFDVPQELVE